jgi:hypothetical protein
MSILTVIVGIGFLGCWFFLRQMAYYLTFYASELEQMNASLTVMTVRIESLRSPGDGSGAHTDGAPS